MSIIAKMSYTIFLFTFYFQEYLSAIIHSAALICFFVYFTDVADGSALSS
jgi:hypothetical protein